MLTATLLFLPLALLLVFLEQRLYAAAQASALRCWLVDHLYLPFLRAGILLVFMFAAYPQLYGLSEAPPLGSLLASGRHRFDTLLNALLVISLLLPLLPLLQRIAGVTLALQGIIATALVANWIALDVGSQIRLMPDALLMLRMAAVLIAARLVAGLLTRARPGTTASREMIFEAARMAAQIPVIVIYARFLGPQLAA